MTEGCSTSGSGEGTLALSLGPFMLNVPSAPFAALRMVPALQGLIGSPQPLLTPRRPKSKAALLRGALTAVGTNTPDWKTAILGVVELGGLVGAAGQLLSPRGPGGSDRTCCEKCCNVATSLPFVVCGCHSMKHRKTREGKTWGLSMVGVGCASAVFHGSWGGFRSWGRKMDYWSIALASNLMTRALYPKVPKAVTVAGMLATPFKPFLVSFVNSSAMELKFLARARKNPKLKGAQRLHAACCALGLGAFALEEWQPDLPLVHSTWHILSATAVSTINHLLADVEQNELQIVA